MSETTRVLGFKNVQYINKTLKVRYIVSLNMCLKFLLAS